MKRYLLILLVILAVPCLARMAAPSKTELIRSAEVVALVEVTDVNSRSKFEEVAKFEVVEIFKGNFKTGDYVLGGRFNACADIRFSKGRYLLFLKRHPEENGLLPAHLQYGVFPLSAQTLNWYENTHSKRRVQQNWTVVELEMQDTFNT